MKKLTKIAAAAAALCLGAALLAGCSGSNDAASNAADNGAAANPDATTLIVGGQRSPALWLIAMTAA